MEKCAKEHNSKTAAAEKFQHLVIADPLTGLGKHCHMARRWLGHMQMLAGWRWVTGSGLQEVALCCLVMMYIQPATILLQSSMIFQSYIAHSRFHSCMTWMRWLWQLQHANAQCNTKLSDQKLKLLRCKLNWKYGHRMKHLPLQNYHSRQTLHGKIAYHMPGPGLTKEGGDEAF